MTLYPVDGGAPTELPELGKDALAVGWNSEGQLWVRSSREAPCRLRLFDIRSRRVVEERTLSPADATGLASIGEVRVTPDDQAIAFDYVRVMGYLYKANGLVAPAR